MMIRRLLLIGLFLLVAPAHARQVAPESAAQSPREFTHPLSYAEQDRPYIVHTPPGYNTDLSHPVVIALHGGGGNPEQFMESSGLNAEADKADMLVVYPSGVPGGRRGALHTWNAGRCCGGAAAKDSDDVGYMGAVLDDLAKNYNIDKKRIYVTGHSNGAMMAYRLSCEMAGRIAAIAAVGGQSVVTDCKPARAVPVLHIHGTADKCAVYEGAEKCGGCFADMVAGLTGRTAKEAENLQWSCDPVPKSLADRAALYGCTAGPAVVHKDGPLKCERWAGCRNRAVVKLCHIEGAGHAWPGGAEPGICQTRPDGRFCQNWRTRTGASAPGVRAAAIVIDFFLSVK